MYKKFYRTKNYSDSLFLDITSSKKKTVVVFVKTFNYQPKKKPERYSKKKKKTLKNKR